jgi:hypothetical protein
LNCWFRHFIIFPFRKNITCDLINNLSSISLFMKSTLASAFGMNLICDSPLSRSLLTFYCHSIYISNIILMGKCSLTKYLIVIDFERRLLSTLSINIINKLYFLKLIDSNTLVSLAYSVYMHVYFHLFNFLVLDIWNLNVFAFHPWNNIIF